MFEDIVTLRDLNAARVQAAGAEDADLIAINNAYNEARQRIVSGKVSYKRCQLIKVLARPVEQHCSLPIAGQSTEYGTIQITAKGFYY